MQQHEKEREAEEESEKADEVVEVAAIAAKENKVSSSKKQNAGKRRKSRDETSVPGRNLKKGQIACLSSNNRNPSRTAGLLKQNGGGKSAQSSLAIYTG